ncbi:MAG: hypothetical protein ACRD0W_10545, partial [Acidimicrobiales bacterium]
MTTTRRAWLTCVLALAAATVAACSDDDEDEPVPGRDNPATDTNADADARDTAGVIVLSTEGNNLNAYEPDPPFREQTVIRSAADDPDGLDINGQVCMLPDGSGFVAGEDTGQPERTPGWGIFELEGATVGELEAREVGRLVPTYQTDGPENYGCGVLSD